MPGRFLSPLDVRVLHDHDARPWLQVLAPLHYQSDRIGTVVIPPGFEFDGASIPTLAMGLLGWPAVRAACVHDYLLALIADGAINLLREGADEVFAEALDACGVGAGTAHVMASAVAAYTRELRRAERGEDPRDTA
jgi:hypothetical protein